MDSINTLHKFGTISLGHDYMKSLIKFGEILEDRERGTIEIQSELAPGSLNVAIWLSFVPLPFRERAQSLIQSIGKEYVGEPATEQTLDQIILEFQDQMYQDELAGHLTSQGWAVV